MRYIKKKEHMFIIGIFSLLIANVIGRFASGFIFSDFLEGLFTGISMVMNLTFLFKYGTEKRMQNRSS